MNDFLFEQAPWEAYLQSCGSTVSAANLLTMLEGEDDSAVEDAFQMIDDYGKSLDMRTLPCMAPSGQASVRLKYESELAQRGLRCTDMDENDPLRLYLEEIAIVPACGDEDQLAEQLSRGNDDAAEQLTTLGLSRVIELAQNYTGYNVLLLDLIQEGSIGLWQAVQQYTTGDYRVFRDRMIENAMCKAILLQARSTGIGQKMRQALQDYRSVDEKLLMELGRNPSLEEIAAGMKITPEEAASIKKMMDDALLLSQAEKLAEPKEEEPEDELAVEDTAYFQMRQRISDLLSNLNDVDAKILTLRFGLEKGLPMTPEETGRQLGLTPAEVNRREAAALAALRS